WAETVAAFDRMRAKLTGFWRMRPRASCLGDEAMSLGTSLVLYLLLGAGVAVAVAARGSRSRGELAFRVLAAVAFWPLFVPLLLSGNGTGSTAETSPRAAPQDELSAAIAQADAELGAALGSLD